MSTATMHQRLTKIEQRVIGPTIAPDQRDPRMVDLAKFFGGRVEDAPVGVLFEDWWAEATANSRIIGTVPGQEDDEE